jgi:hypothetical protein
MHVSVCWYIRVITKLPNSEQSYKGKVKISQQPDNCENRNDPDLVQAFLKKWWVVSDFKPPNLPLSLRFKGSLEQLGLITGISAYDMIPVIISVLCCYLIQSYAKTFANITLYIYSLHTLDRDFIYFVYCLTHVSRVCW